MESAIRMQDNPVEIGILAKWLLHQTWNSMLDVVDRHSQQQTIHPGRKEQLQTMYTSFYCHAYYSPVRTKRDIDTLLKNTREMLQLFKQLDKNAWEQFMTEYNLKES